MKTKNNKRRLKTYKIKTINYTDAVEKPIADSSLDSRIAYYEVLWYEGDNERDALRGDFKTKEFKTKNEAMNFYRREKNDKRKFAFWITGRRPNGDLEEDVLVDSLKAIDSKYSEEYHYLQDKLLEYERKGIGTEEEYERNKARLAEIQDLEWNEEVR